MPRSKVNETRLRRARSRLRDAQNELAMLLRSAGPFPPYKPSFIPLIRAASRRVNARRAEVRRLKYGSRKEREQQDRDAQQTLELQGGGSGRLLGEF